MNNASGTLVVISMIMALVLSQPLCSAASPPGAAGNAGYDISLSDLKRVEKKGKKPERKGRKGKNAAKGALQENSVDAAKPVEGSDQNVLATKETADGVRITHDPNSYVITGKRTVIKAVISSMEPLQSARCLFRSLENGGYAFVPMAKSEGSLYTYATTLPVLSGGARSLRYRFVAVDVNGKVTRSQEFVIPVVHSSVMPGWQLEPTQETVKASLENPNQKALEGFENVTVIEATLKQ